ncbi:MAG TPA: polysaccharide deacetylase family protein [Solirubrobacteraceae bacterium]|jgi:peptidoglycan/xylan/chitin deacetylase (PgdA/CDA1 family)|nr:polysaccharide deacetylase family protein [Solirubrobacteraceae bacterium]
MDESGLQQRAARRTALARAHQRRRLTAIGTILVIVAIVLLALNRSGPTGRPPAPEASASVPAPHGKDARRLGAADAAVDRVLAYSSYVSRGAHQRKEVALTFDDGPGPTTPALLRYLVANGVPATFFLVGKAIARYPEVVRQESDAGFMLGTHTDSHARLASRTFADQQQEILTGADRITRFTGHAVRLFRPPYGAFDANTLNILRAERMLMVLWSVDTRDFSAKRAAPIVSATLAGSRAGAVILLHDGPGPRPQTLKAVRRIVTKLRRDGYRIVSLPRLLRDDPPPRNQPVPRSLDG